MATLTVSIQEEITINGKDRGNTNSISITSVTETFNRVLTASATEQNIIEFQATNPSGGALANGTCQYLRVTNLDSSNNVDLRVQTSTDTKEYLVRIGALESFILFNDTMDVNATSANLDGVIDLDQIEVIKAKVPTASTADIEIFAVAT